MKKLRKVFYLILVSSLITCNLFAQNISASFGSGIITDYNHIFRAPQVQNFLIHYSISITSDSNLLVSLSIGFGMGSNQSKIDYFSDDKFSIDTEMKGFPIELESLYFVPIQKKVS